MTISRADLADYLDSQFSALASTVGQDTNAAIGYAPDIDATWRKLGVVRADLATATIADSQEESAQALAEFYAARRFWRQLSANVNVKIDNSAFDYKTVIASAKTLMDDAAAICGELGYGVAMDAWSIGSLNLDFLEPETAIGYDRSI